MIVILGSLLLPVTLVLFPLLIFNKSMRHFSSKYTKLRFFNWALFAVTVGIGTCGLI
jgi:hypothetical protein